MDSERSKDRREFLCGMGRILALALLAGSAGGLAARREAKRIDTCIGDSVCRDCRALDECGLPQALSLKRIEKRGKRGA